MILSICVALGLFILIGSIICVFILRTCRGSKHHQGAKSKAKKLASSQHSLNANIYSRNSSSSSSNSTTATSSTSTSPKGNEITVCCGDEEDDEEERHNILTIDPGNQSVGHHNYNPQMHSQQHMFTQRSAGGMFSNNTSIHNPASMLLSNRSSNLNDFLMQQRNLNSIYCNPPSHYMNHAMSSGSSSVCTSLLLNNLNHLNSANTTQSFVVNSHMNENLNNVNGYGDEAPGDDEDDDEDPTEGDFIVSTTSNLEFLKAHSLFNSTPLNYYPSLTLTSSNFICNNKQFSWIILLIFFFFKRQDRGLWKSSPCRITMFNWC